MAPHQTLLCLVSPVCKDQTFPVLVISAHLRKMGTKEVSDSGGIRKCMNQKRDCIHLSGNAHLMDSMSCSVFLKLADSLWGLGLQRCPVLDKCSTTEQACLSSYFNKVQELQEGKDSNSSYTVEPPRQRL